jgi:PrtD family type I secretion system ABC transporter
MKLVTKDGFVPSKDAMRDALRSCSSAFVAISLFSFVVNLFILTVPLYMFSVFDKVLTSYSMATLGALFAMACFALGIQALVDISRSYVLIEVGNFLEKRLSGRLLKLSIQRSAHRGNARGIGPVQSFQRIKMFLTSQSIFNLMDAPWIPIFLGILFLMNPAVGMVATFGAIALFVLALINDRWGKKPMADAQRASGKSLRMAETAARNADVVEAMGMTSTVINHWQKGSDESAVFQSLASRRSAIISAISKWLRMIIQIGVMTTAAIDMISPGSTASPGLLMASVILVGRALMPLESMIGAYSQVLDTLQAYEGVNQLLETEGDRPELSVFPLSPRGQIDVEGVTYTLNNAARPLLSNVSFSVQPGEVIGVIGPSGAGKTTLATLLVGLEKATSGHVRMDGTDVFTWPSEDLGRYVGYLPQSVELFNGTIRDNISRLDPNVTAEKVIHAAELAGLHDMVQRFEHEYDTEVGEGGARLSGGQRQRVGLARALYGTPKLVVLDEPNSNLDSTGENALVQTLGRLRAVGCTVFIIAHRVNILQHVDKVLAMQNGVIQRFAERDKVITAVPEQPKVAEDKAKAIADGKRAAS